MKTICRNCGKAYNLNPQLEGAIMRCQCGNRLKIEETPEPTPSIKNTLACEQAGAHANNNSTETPPGQRDYSAAEAMPTTGANTVEQFSAWEWLKSLDLMPVPLQRWMERSGITFLICAVIAAIVIVPIAPWLRIKYREMRKEVAETRSMEEMNQWESDLLSNNAKRARKYIESQPNPENVVLNVEILIAELAGSGCADTVALMLEYGANPNCIGQYGMTALQRAREINYVKVVKVLLNDERTDVFQKDSMGMDALGIAVDGGNRECVHAILNSMHVQNKSAMDNLNIFLTRHSSWENDGSARHRVSYLAVKDHYLKLVKEHNRNTGSGG